MTAKPVTVSIDADKLDKVDGWVRQGRYESRSKAFEAGLDLLLRRNARPTLEEALAAYARLTDEQKMALERDSEAIDAEADAMNAPDAPSSSAA
jgi:Arc/MetJ-type ribon-helix-helix transcriptional regulator